jgi:hypothetical protein
MYLNFPYRFSIDKYSGFREPTAEEWVHYSLNGKRGVRMPNIRSPAHLPSSFLFPVRSSCRHG